MYQYQGLEYLSKPVVGFSHHYKLLTTTCTLHSAQHNPYILHMLHMYEQHTQIPNYSLRSLHTHTLKAIYPIHTHTYHHRDLSTSVILANSRITHHIH